MNMTTLLSVTQTQRIGQWMPWDLQGIIEAPAGSHLTTPRNGYFHHGIYLGSGKVIHNCGLFGGLHGGAVKIVSLERFAAGRTVQYRCDQLAVFGSAEVIRRALSRMGENHYRVLTNNCEHFCNWCLYGRSSSEQVRRFLTHPLSALRLVLNVLPGLVQQVRCGYLPA